MFPLAEYGARIQGVSQQLLLDQRNGPQHVIDRGVFGISSGANGGRLLVRFNRVIDTQEKPFVYGQIRPNTGPTQASLVCYDFKMEGGPGGWTGFSFAALGNAFGDTTWKWVVCSNFPPASGATHGMRLRRITDGRAIFDTGWPVMRFIFATRAWNRSASGAGATTYWAWDTAVGYNVRADAYFLMNTVVTPRDGIAGFDAVYVPAIYVYSNRARFTMQITGANGSSPNYIQPVVYAMPSDEW